MSIEALREIVTRLNASLGALTALGAALDAQATGSPLPPALQGPIGEVLGALGARDAMEGVAPAELRALVLEIRMNMLHGAKLLSAGTREPGWTHADTEILQTTGEVSSSFPHAVKRMIAPQLEGLSERLDARGASFLDIGVGVAALSMEMARLWPALHVVGLDVWTPSLAIARESVRRAGLADRIELREQAAQDLPDTDAFDLAWVPSLFIRGELLAPILERVRHALRPGGWILFAMMNPGGDPLMAGLARLRTVLSGGVAMSPGDAEALLTGAGFASVRTLPGPPNALAAMIVGRRPPAGPDRV